MSDEFKKLEKRVSELEEKLRKPKKERKQSEYNTFVKDYIDEQKKKNTTKTHKELFKEAAGAWSLNKEKK